MRTTVSPIPCLHFHLFMNICAVSQWETRKMFCFLCLDLLPDTDVHNLHSSINKYVFNEVPDFLSIWLGKFANIISRGKK